MRARATTTIVAATCLAVSMTASVLVQHRIDELHPRATIEDVLYISSPKLVKRASLGFDGLMACIYWTRTVQYFGHRHYNGEQTYDELAPLLEITTTLDPYMLPAYLFGANFLAPDPPNGAGQPQQAIRLIEYGIEHNPDEWRLYWDLGFVYYTGLKDYKKASEVFAQGSRIPHTHPFLRILAARTAENAGDFTTARMLWSATFESSHETSLRRNAMEHLRCLKVDEDVTNLQVAATRFSERTGRRPSSMAELVAAEHLPGVPTDPDGHPYKLSGEGRVLVENPDDFPFITTGTPPGYKPPLPKFHKNL